jgi:DEAD/DEAH box helicase domain-containing protein
VLLDDEESEPDEPLHLAWRYWLRLFQVFQVLPGMVMMTKRGWNNGDAQAAMPKAAASGPAVPDVAGLNEVWRLAIDMALESVRPGLEQMAKKDVNLPVPEVGFELADGSGRVVAEAELAWQQQRLAVLVDGQSDQAAAWGELGWTVVMADQSSAGSIVDPGTWALKVLEVIQQGEDR